MTTLVRAEGLTRRFALAHGAVVALEAVDLDLPAGRLVAIMGPSGCGKSTLLNLIGLLDRPSSGRLDVAGTETAGLDDLATAALRRAEVGFLFQDAGLVERMSVLDNVMLPLEYRAPPFGGRLAHADQAIAALGLDHRRSAMVDTLSGGERQRVGLARVLAVRPRLIICDEPTASLDEANSHLVLDRLLEAAREGALVVCASHDPIVLERAHRRVIMARGKVTSVEGAA